MQIYVLSGEPGAVARRTRQLSGGTPQEVVDAAEGGRRVLRAVASPPLFTDTKCVVVENAGELGAEDVAALTKVRSSSVVVLLSERRLKPTLLRALGDAAAVEHFTEAKRPQDVYPLLRDSALHHGVALGSQQREFLAVAYLSEPERIHGALWQLSVVGATQPTLTQVRAVVAASHHDVPPWAVVERLADGDVAGALVAARDSNPAVVVQMLSREHATIGTLLDGGVRDADAAAELLGRPAFQLRRAVAVARRSTPESVAAGWRVLADMHLGTRARHAAEHTAVGVVAMASCWSGEVPPQA